MFGKIEGQRLNLAKMCIANYCLALKDQAGSVDVLHVVSGINDDFGLVHAKELGALVGDVTHFFNCLESQQVDAFDRGGYWKWRAMSAFDARNDLARELKALQV